MKNFSCWTTMLLMSVLVLPNGYANEQQEPGHSNEYELTMDEAFFFLEKVPAFKVDYEVELTYHQPKQVKEVKGLGMYNPNLPQERIDEWKAAQAGERSQVVKRSLLVNDQRCIWVVQADAGPIFPEEQEYRFTLDYAKNESVMQFFQPAAYRTTPPIHSMIAEHNAHFLLSPSQLFGMPKQPFSLPEEALTTIVSKENDNKTIFVKKENGDIFGIVEKHPDYDRVQSAVYMISPVLVSEITYSDYKQNEALGFVVPKTITLKRYKSRSIAERSADNLSSSQKISISGIELLDQKLGE